jgi:hypothetical protein
MRLIAGLLVIAAIAGACAGGPPTDSWTIGDYRVDVPIDWTVHEDPNEDGFNEINPPSGDGNLLLLEISDRNPPDEVTKAYALDHARRGMTAAGLSTEDLEVLDHGSGHFSVTSEGFTGEERRHVLATVHVFPQGFIVLGFFHGLDGADPNIDAARDILSSVRPSD